MMIIDGLFQGFYRKLPTSPVSTYPSFSLDANEALKVTGLKNTNNSFFSLNYNSSMINMMSMKDGLLQVCFRLNVRELGTEWQPANAGYFGHRHSQRN